MEPFLFKSYDRILGIACDLESLITNYGVLAIMIMMQPVTTL